MGQDDYEQETLSARIKRLFGLEKLTEDTHERICAANVRLMKIVCPLVFLGAIVVLVMYFVWLPSHGQVFGDRYVLAFVSILLLLASIMLFVVAMRYSLGINTKQTTVYAYLALFMVTGYAYAIAFSTMSFAALGRMSMLYVFFILFGVIFVLNPLVQILATAAAIGSFFAVLSHMGLSDSTLVVSCLTVALMIVFAGMLRYEEQCRNVNSTLRSDTASKTDALTGLNNRMALDSDVPGFVGHGIIVAMLDIDDFKHFNDTYTHETGDIVLQKFARTVEQCFPDEHVYRYGGDEFVVVAVDTRNEPRFRELARRFIGMMKTTRIENAPDETIGTSLGYAMGKIHDEFEFHVLLHLADQELYKAKNAGKGRFCGTVMSKDNIPQKAVVQPTHTSAKEAGQRASRGVQGSETESVASQGLQLS